MKRVDITYDGNHYSIGGREIEDIEAEIEAAISSGRPSWLSVNSGEGRTRVARLLITAGVAISLVPVVGDDDIASIAG